MPYAAKRAANSSASGRKAFGPKHVKARRPPGLVTRAHSRTTAPMSDRKKTKRTQHRIEVPAAKLERLRIHNVQVHMVELIARDLNLQSIEHGLGDIDRHHPTLRADGMRGRYGHGARARPDALFPVRGPRRCMSASAANVKNAGLRCRSQARLD
jgi:hypothetical protein